jgi:menaquinol-cytochrome c reductase iron-sulfur subunit
MTPDTPEPSDRRDFLTKAAAVAIGTVSTLVPVGAGLVTIFDPLRRRSAESGPILVTTLNALPNDGKPRRFQIVADRQDAWNKYPQVPIGAVYLRRVNEKTVEALNVTCPHAGCPVEFKEADGSFLCPCHDSKFKLDGTIDDPKSPSPRALDSLEVEIRNDSEIWVTYRNFEPGKSDKIPLA